MDRYKCLGMNDDADDLQDGVNTAIIDRSETEVLEPSMYRVILHNDDYTPMDFVVYILEKFFRKNNHQATEIMLNVHEQGFGVCGVYPLDVAETKVTLVLDSAKTKEYPLKCTMEKDE
ncbi:MAG: ATP-dependent Clp protease adapter ClpS [Bdellovibrionota bacterium]